MRTKAERLTQIRNAFAACAASLLCAAAVSVITYFCFKPAAVMLFVVFATAFALALAVLILLWKKTDLLRNVLYLIHCIRNPKNSRKYYCPCCNRYIAGFSDFRLYEDTERYDPIRFKKHRQDVMCPFCYSAPRQRILAFWAKANISLLKGSDILYFAPEYSMMKWFRNNGINLTTADLFDPKTDLKLDITSISLSDCSYEIVICNHVLEHVSSYDKALNELNRILKPGGILIISFPIDPSLDSVFEKEVTSPEDRVHIFGQNDHVRLFGNDSRELIGKYGFNVSVIDTGKMPESILPITGPADYDSNQIFYCKKSSK